MLKLISGLLIGIFLLLAYNTFSGTLPLTGDLTGEKNQTAIPLNAKLTVPDLILNGNFREVKIVAGSDSYIKAGDEEIYLGKLANNYIILKNFSGEINLNSKKIIKLKGEVSEVIFNGYPLNLKDNVAKISLDKSTSYSSFEIDEGISIGKLSYTTSGNLILDDGKNAFDITNEKVELSKFNGGLKINKDLFELSGEAGKIKIIGDNEIIIE
ncbi:MAG: hypothetical protein AABX28_01555 [Nanoarchaeota archaeon]